MLKKKIRRQRKKRKKQIILISSFCLILIMAVGYAAFQTNLSITARGNIKEKTRVIQSWEQASQTDFHSDFYKQNIVSVTFLDNNNIPRNATESWNVSEDKENGGVMAWVVPNSSDNTKYDLYIGAKAGVIANKNSSNLFYNFQKVQSINFDNNFDTSNVTNIGQLFYKCSNLQRVDVNNLDVSQVIKMNSVFNGCQEIKNIDISTWNTSKVTDMSGMFMGCENIITLDLFNFKTQNVTHMSHMFQNMHNLTNLNISSFDTKNVSYFEYMFCDDHQLTTLDGLEKFNTSKAINMAYMFYNVAASSLNLCSFDTRNVTNMYAMFEATVNIRQIKVGSNWTTTNADTTYMFTSSGVSSVTTGQC